MSAPDVRAAKRYVLGRPVSVDGALHWEFIRCTDPIDLDYEVVQNIGNATRFIGTSTAQHHLVGAQRYPEDLDATGFVVLAVNVRTEVAMVEGHVDPLATDESPRGLAQAYAWWHFQNGYRRSQAIPPERSIGCEADIEHLRALANAWGRPDPRAVVEIGMEHLWQIVYGEPYPT